MQIEQLAKKLKTIYGKIVAVKTTTTQGRHVPTRCDGQGLCHVYLHIPIYRVFFNKRSPKHILPKQCPPPSPM